MLLSIYRENKACRGTRGHGPSRGRARQRVMHSSRSRIGGLPEQAMACGVALGLDAFAQPGSLGPRGGRPRRTDAVARIGPRCTGHANPWMGWNASPTPAFLMLQRKN
jgi:hypothetical protein